MKKIVSDHNSTLRQAIRLHESRGRRQQQRIIIFGSNEIRLARQAGVAFSEIFFCEDRLARIDSQLIQAFTTDNVDMITLSPALFRKLAFGDRNDGIVATARRPARSLSQIDLPSDALVVVLESMEKPGNLGAVFRSADAAGVTAVFIADNRCDPFHPNAIRASLGSVFSIAWAAASSAEVRDLLVSNQFQIVAAKVDARSSYADVDMTGKTAIALGSEHTGLSQAWNTDQILDVAIPMSGQVDSLNVSVSASIMMFEAQRQRRTGSDRTGTR